MLKSFFSLFMVVSSTITYSSRIIICILTKKDSKKPFFKLSKGWGNSLVKWGRVTLDIHGRENTDDSENYIFCANHSSLFDIPTAVSAINQNVRIIYKQELEKIPIFGRALNLSPFISVNRSNPRESMSSIEKAIEAAKTGDSVLIYPEGTRSKDGQLQSFKRGAFMLAARAGKAIVPMAIIGANKVMSGKFTMNPTTVKIKFGTPIRKEVKTPADEKALLKEVHKAVSDMMEEEKVIA